MMNDAGIYLKHYPASQPINASPSVLTWRILVRVVEHLATTLQQLDVSRNTGVDLEVIYILFLYFILSLFLYCRLLVVRLIIDPP